MAPLAPYIDCHIADNDQFCGSNGQCCRTGCQEWIDGKPCYPELVRDDKYGFAICPKCGGSYGAAALTGQEYHDRIRGRYVPVSNGTVSTYENVPHDSG